MKRLSTIDEFYYKQPPLSFVDELKKTIHSVKMPFFGTGKPMESETDVSGVYLCTDEYDDEKGLLETSYKDFNDFISLYKIDGKRYPIKIRKGSTSTFEAYEINVTNDFTIITADDTEGVRRALIYIEEEMLRHEGAFLTMGITKRSPHIKTRITRGFFSPTNRAPKSIDELYNDIDYYPDNYLYRLMHDGINGIWIYTRFSDLLPSSFITEYGQESERRIAKLNALVKKCARFGIKVYIFAIEPFFFKDNKELNEKYKDILGAEIEGGYHALCTKTEFVRNYCEEAGEKLCTLVPDIGGWIGITVGEGLTSCVSNIVKTPCPRCGKQHKGEVLAEAVDILKSGIRKSNSKAEFISWTYAHRTWEHNDIREYVRNAPDDCVLMQNFDDMVFEEQLGKTRMGMDYWLSVVGPSEIFKITALEALDHGKRVFAKMQVCCSHEVASVPYVPVPGILFNKYKEAYKCKVEGVVQCWYFGNYPCMMSKAAGELAFEQNFEDEEEFLNRLASLYWGRSNASQIVKAWKLFEEGYRHYPINIMVSYYGPMHDGVVWELALKPKNFSLPRTWMLMDKPDGDRINECLMCGHTLSEVVQLTEIMVSKWKKGIEEMKKVALSYEFNEQLCVAEALGILFESGNDIFRFYELREKLGNKEGNPSEILEEMKGIVKNEMLLSEKMIPLCEKDGRLGYHSEAEGYKFFPEKLKHRINALQKLLDTELKEVKKRIADNMAPLEYYEGIEPGSKAYSLCPSDQNAKWEYIGEEAAFRASFDSENLYIDLKCDTEFHIYPEFELMHPSVPVKITDKGQVSISCSKQHWSIFGDKEKTELNKWNVSKNGEMISITLSRADIAWTKDTPFKIKLMNSKGETWCLDDNPVNTLGKNELSPMDFGWFKPIEPAIKLK